MLQEEDKESGSLYGKKENISRDSGKMEKRKVMECGDQPKAMCTKGNGRITNKTEREYISILGDQSILVTSKISLNTEEANSNSKTEISIWGSTVRANLMVTVHTLGKMETYTKGISMMDLDRDKVHCSCIKEMYCRVTSRMTNYTERAGRNTPMVNISKDNLYKVKKYKVKPTQNQVN